MKTLIRQAQVKAALAVNRELVLLYWQMGKDILARQEQEDWGARVITRPSADLRKAFPGMKDLSRTNQLYIPAFSEIYKDEKIVQQLAGQFPWFHNCVLIDKVKDPEQRKWYINKTIENGWSHNVLAHHIDSRLYECEGRAITNFAATLPARNPTSPSNSSKTPITSISSTFKPEYAGKMNVYLAVLDDLVKHPDDQPSIGIILCRSKGDAKVRYALQRIASPIGVSTHQLPKGLEESLPTVETLKQELKTVDVEGGEGAK